MKFQLAMTSAPETVASATCSARLCDFRFIAFEDAANSTGDGTDYRADKKMRDLAERVWRKLERKAEENVIERRADNGPA